MLSHYLDPCEEVSFSGSEERSLRSAAKLWEAGQRWKKGELVPCGATAASAILLAERDSSRNATHY